MTILLIASAGGHLKELHTLLPRLGLDDEQRLWITFDNPMSRSLLAGEDVLIVPYIHPRDIRHTASNARIALSVVRKVRPTAAISTGSGVALAWLPVAAAFGTSTHFIETATRTQAPSICGKLLRPVPRVHVYSQYRSWAKHGVHYAGSIFEGFDVQIAPRREIQRVLVTVGSNETYGFERLIRRLVAILPPEAEVVWQVGCSDVTGLGIEGRTALPLAEIETAHDWADVIVAHAGVGSAITALEHGKVPLLVPRRLAHGEHIDDHQINVAGELARSGLAVTADADAVTLDDLVHAASQRALTRTDPPLLRLVG